MQRFGLKSHLTNKLQEEIQPLTDPKEVENLLERARGGDQTAFKKLYEAHVEALYRFLFQFSDHRPQVRDWVQRSFIKAFTRLDQFEGRSRFKTWLWRIGINEMRMDLRGRFDPNDTEEWSPETGNQKETVPIETILTMRNEINKLTPRKKIVLLLFEVEGYAHSEIATMLDISEGSSRSILSRTKSELRETIGKKS